MILASSIGAEMLGAAFWCIVAALVIIVVGIQFAIFSFTVKYAARKNAQYFDYDYLAKRIAYEFKYEEMAVRNGKEIRNGINYDLLAKKIAEQIQNSGNTSSESKTT